MANSHKPVGLKCSNDAVLGRLYLFTINGVPFLCVHQQMAEMFNILHSKSLLAVIFKIKILTSSQLYRLPNLILYSAMANSHKPKGRIYSI